MTHHTRRPAWTACLALGLLLCACGTTRNRRADGRDLRRSSTLYNREVAQAPGSSETPGAEAARSDAPRPDRSNRANRPDRSGSGEATEPEALAAAPSAPVARLSATASDGADPVIAVAAGQDIRASDLLELWLFRESSKVRSYLEELVLSNLVVAEAARIGIVIEDARLDRAVDRSLGALRENIGKGAGAAEVDDFIRQRLGLDPSVYRARLRRETEIDLLAERAVRSWLLQSERAEVRVIVVDDRATVDVVQAALDRGEDFSKLAEEYSVEESGSTGGRVPPVVRSPVALSRLAFSTPVGDVGGPVLERDRYLFLKVDERREALEGTWTDLREAVEASLLKQTIEDPEYWQWKTAMLERYSVDMTPFLEFVGEPHTLGAAGDGGP